MSTDLNDGEQGVRVTRFFGGTERGTCYQIGTDTPEGYQYIQLTAVQVREMIRALAASGIDTSWDWRNQ